MKDNNKRLQELSDNYEVEFDPAAWDKMEKLLPDAASPRLPFYENLKLIAAMMILCIAIYFALSGGLNDANPDTTRAEKQTRTEEITNSAADRAPFAPQQKDLSPPTETEEKIAPPAAADAGNPAPISTSVPNKPLPTPAPPIMTPKPLPVNNPFYQKISETLRIWSESSNPEKAYLHTDRPFYKPGESIWFAAYLRNADDLRPSRKSDLIYAEWVAPNGKTLKKFKLVAKNGVAAGDILTLPTDVGGVYQLKAYTNWQRNTETVFFKDIQLQKSVLPRLRMELDFQREAYGPGDAVQARLDLKTLENTALSNYDFSYTVSLEGEEVETRSGTTNALGYANISFNLPSDLDSNDGLLNVLISYNGQTESVARPVPIVLNRIDLQFFPEGGQHLADIESKTAFKAVNEFGEPADIEGVVLNDAGEEVVTFNSYHQGHGAFTWTPHTGENYTVRITRPTGIAEEFALPPALSSGYSLSVKNQTNDTLTAEVITTENETLHLIAQARDRIVFYEEIPAGEEFCTVNIPTRDFPIGITQLTLFDSREIARAERLVFVNADRKLDIKITTDKEKYQPREQVKMTVQVRDAAGKAVPGIYSLAVADDNLLTYADDKQPHILSQMLLQSDLRGEIEEPNFYFDPPKPGEMKDKKKALDLLLLTQGWRRFTWEKSDNLPVADTNFPNEKSEIAGIVRDKEGKPAVGIKVRLQGREKPAVTDADGRFVFAEVEYSAQPYVLTVKDKYEITRKVKGYNSDLVISLMSQNTSEPVIIARRTSKTSGLRGTVYDAAHNDPLIGMSIFAKGTTYGTVTDFDGNFFLPLPPGEFDVQFQYIGYQNRNLPVQIVDSEEVIIDLAMEEPDMLLEEVVVTGGSIRRQNRTAALNVQPMNRAAGKERKKRKKERVVAEKAQVFADAAIAEEMPAAPQPTAAAPFFETKKDVPQELPVPQLRAEDVRNLPTRDVSALQAKTAGVVVDQGDAINIRGSRSDNTAYFIDGIRVSGDLPTGENEQKELVLNGRAARFENNESQITIRGLRATAAGNNPLLVIDGRRRFEIPASEVDFIDTEDIKKIEVLDKNAAAAQFGNAARNGAVIISTKSGKGLSQKAGRRLLREQMNSFELFTEELKERAALGELSTSDNSSFYRKFNSLRNTHQQFDAGDKTKIYARASELHKVGEEIIKGYENAQKFTEGFYRARTFYTPKYERDFEQNIVRNDFRSTIYWNPAVEVGDDGKATIEFPASDEITTFRATVEGFGNDGGIGRGEATFYSILPFGLMTKVPANVMTGDVLQLPVTLMNNTDENLTGFLTIEAPHGFAVSQDVPQVFTLQGGEKRTIGVAYTVLSDAEDGIFKVQFVSDALSDAFEQEITVLKRGFPVREVVSGNALKNKFTFRINDPTAAGVQVQFKLYPSLADDLTAGTERMLRQPRGCFEQTSSSNYPNLLVLDLLRSTGKADPALEKRALALLDAGYKRLTGFEVAGGGFDWFGKPPAHEALTAYGLMQFIDLQAVYPVQESLINRTADWLFSRRDGQGGWSNSKAALHSWSAQTPVSEAYIVWAMSEAGYAGELEAEIEKSYRAAVNLQDPYLLALMTLTLQNAEDARAEKLLSDLIKLRAADGTWTGKTHSMTHSKGKSLTIETTALAVLALLRSGGYGTEVTEAAAYLTGCKSQYGFGNTQSTVLAMKALVAYAKNNPLNDTKGEVALFIDGQKVKTQTYSKGLNSAILFDDLAAYFTPGVHTVEVKFNKEEAILPFDFTVSYQTKLPPTAPDCAVTLTTRLIKSSVRVGETVRYTAELRNVSNGDVANPLAVIGIPAGLTVQPQQLKQMQERSVFDYYELKGNYVVLYFRGLAQGATATVNLDLKADIGGGFAAPASVAYLYYQNELRHWVGETEVEVLP